MKDDAKQDWLRRYTKTRYQKLVDFAIHLAPWVVFIFIYFAFMKLSENLYE